MTDLSRWTKRALPPRAALDGRYARLEPLDPARHGDALFAASMAPGAEERHRYLFDAPMDGRLSKAGWSARRRRKTRCSSLSSTRPRAGPKGGRR